MMAKIYTGIELGSNEIKVLVQEVIGNQYHVLSAVSVPSNGVKKRQIVDSKVCASDLLHALKKTEEEIGLKITEAILVLPPHMATFTMQKGTSSIEEKVVQGYDVKKAMKDAVFHQYDTGEELISVLPISFSIDDGNSVFDPKGKEGNVLFSKVVMATISKEVLAPFLQVFRMVGVHIKDYVFAPQADYETCESHDLNRKMGAILNLGEDESSVSIFNKGILIKNENIPVGSRFVDKDLSYIYKIPIEPARTMKETFAITSYRYADTNEWMEVTKTNGEKLNLNQAETSKIIESRIQEILKLVKNAINNLTKREISYIIVVGGISELAGFSYLVEDLFGHKASVWNMQELGARHNKFTTVFGSCKYYHKKCSFLEENGTMFKEEVISSFVAPKKRGVIGVDGSINKFFGHMMDN